jgi:hypothetical protein
MPWRKVGMKVQRLSLYASGTPRSALSRAHDSFHSWFDGSLEGEGQKMINRAMVNKEKTAPIVYLSR